VRNRWLEAAEESIMKIFVGNLSREVGEADLLKAFSTFGQVSAVTVLRYRHTGEPRGSGSVEMPEKTEARAAITGLNDQMIRGRRIMVHEAREQGTSASGRTVLPA
jgi:RNA recognition motif-containing protein